MSGLLQIHLKLEVGQFFKACDGELCRTYRVRRVRVTRAGPISDLIEVAGSFAVDPVVAHYDALLKAGEHKKEAVRLTRLKFRIGRSTFFRRLAAR